MFVNYNAIIIINKQSEIVSRRHLYTDMQPDSSSLVIFLKHINLYWNGKLMKINVKNNL